MSATQILVVIVVLIPIILVIRNRLRIDVAALLMALLLGIAQFFGLGVLGAPQTPAGAIRAIEGLSQPVVVTLLSLFIVTRCLDRTGVTRWITRRILVVGGQSEARLILLFTAATALLSLFMNNLAAGALMLPSAVDVSRRSGIRPSKLLIPVAYGSLLGGSATYFTTANIIASDLLTTAQPPQAPLHVLDFTPTGGLIALTGIVLQAWLGPRLLPDRPPRLEQTIARRTGSELEDVYRLDERLWEVVVPAGTTAVGKTLSDLQLGQRLGITVAAIWRGRKAIFAPTQDQVVASGDILLTIGREEQVNQLGIEGFKVGRNSDNVCMSARGVRFAEVVLSPHSQAQGNTLRELAFREQHGLTVVALLRDNRSYRTNVADIKLQPGDSLLTVGRADRLKSLQANPDFVVIEPDYSDQPIDIVRASLSVAIVFGAIAASIFGMPVFLAMLAAVLLVFILGLLPVEDAYRTVEWQAIFLIAGMYAVSLAMVNTGLADLIGQQVIRFVLPFGPLGLAAGAYLLTAGLTQIIGGQVSMLVTGPIVISSAIQLNVSPQAIAVAAAIGCSASFITPIAHPVNLLMIGPGNYTFTDFFHLGWRLTIACFVMLMVGMALFWGLV